MAYDAGLVARISDLLSEMGHRAVRQRGVFGGRGFLRGRSTFVIAWSDGLLVKCAKTDYSRALDCPGVAPFAPDGERPMSTWVVVAADQIAEDPELREWILAALRSLETVDRVKP